MWSWIRRGGLGLIFGPLVWWTAILAWAGPRKMPDEGRLQEAEELKEEYERLYEEGKYSEAAKKAKRACVILKEEVGESSLELAECMNNLGACYHDQGAYRKAAPLLERACVIMEERAGVISVAFADCINNLGVIYGLQGAYDTAEMHIERALVARKKAQGPDHPDVAKSLNSLAWLHEVQGEYGQAEPLYERALAILEDSLSPDHPDVANGLNGLARLHEVQGEYGQAESLYERALAILEDSLSPDHPDIANSLDNLAALHQIQGEYGKAEPLYERALAIREMTLAARHPVVAQSLNNLGILYRDQGDFGKAESLLERALAIQEKALGPSHPHVAISLNNLAVLYHDQGAYGKAEILCKRALGIREKELGPDHPHVAQSLNNLARLYDDQGEGDKAESLYKRALVIYERAPGPDYADVAHTLNNLAVLYRSQEEYGKAEQLHKRALAIREKTLGPNHFFVASSLSNLALLYTKQGAYDTAEPLYQRALAIKVKALGPNHPSVAASFNNLAFLYSTQRAYGKAEPLFERALAIKVKALGASHPSISTSLNNLAALYHEQGSHYAALELHRRGLDIQEANFVRTLTVASEVRRLAFASTLSNSLHYVLSIHLLVAPEHNAIAELALTTLLRRKSRVQDLVAQSKAALRRSLPEDDRHLLDELSVVDSRIAVLTGRGPTEPAVQTQLDEFRQERDRLWNELAEHSALVGALNRTITIEDVQGTLPAGDALVEFVQYVPQHDDDGRFVWMHKARPPPRYAAYLVFSDHIDWVDLGRAAPIDEHVGAFRKALAAKHPIPTHLYDAVMQPIVDKLGSTHHLVIAPAGALSLIPFGALHDGEHYLIEQYDLRYVTTGRDLLDPPATPSVTTTPVTVVANPTGTWLADAKLEADFLTHLFPATRILQGNHATETNVRTIERPLVLHMATHGFFGKARNDRDNPMFRSGLVLADIERVEVDREHDDGQLTAYEVSGMDLRGTQLVVLSACETGLGEVDMSEGVFGLRRAFAVAGAQTTVMSLWKVTDEAARATMEAYYGKLAQGLGRGEAMQAVQLEMLHGTEHAHPSDWAVFVVSGEEGPMVFPEGLGPRVDEEGPPPPPPGPRCSLTRSSDHRDPEGSMFIGLLGLAALRRRKS